jgi:hypothetical protein
VVSHRGQLHRQPDRDHGDRGTAPGRAPPPPAPLRLRGALVLGVALLGTGIIHHGLTLGLALLGNGIWRHLLSCDHGVALPVCGVRRHIYECFHGQAIRVVLSVPGRLLARVVTRALGPGAAVLHLLLGCRCIGAGPRPLVERGLENGEARLGLGEVPRPRVAVELLFGDEEGPEEVSLRLDLVDEPLLRVGTPQPGAGHRAVKGGAELIELPLHHDVRELPLRRRWQPFHGRFLWQGMGNVGYRSGRFRCGFE